MLRFGKDASLKEDTLLLAGDTEELIEQVDAARDLGVQMDNKADWCIQRESVIMKTKNKASWVLRTFRSRSPGLMRTLWRTLVQPHQDYASQLWAPVGRLGDIQAQEAPLRAFTKKIWGYHDIPYNERLQKLNMLSTERRQERYRILYTWKALNGLVPHFGLEPLPRQSGRGNLVKIPSLTGPQRWLRTLRQGTL